MDILLDEYKKLLLLLVKHKVDFMLIGGYAVIYYGYERSTTDMDIWLKPDNNNRDKLIPALKEFGIKSVDLEKLSSADFKTIQFFYFGTRPLRIDFLTKISGVGFEEAAAQANHFPLADKKVPIIHFNHLILSKITNERTQDKADVEELQKIQALKKKK